MLPPRWHVERLIGSGGQADVWLAFDTELSETVVIKLFRAMPGTVARERLRREVRLGRSIQHPRVVRMFELIEAGDRLGLVMEWVPGGTVSDLVKAGPVPIDAVVRIATEVLEALEVLHAAGVIHRDVKPSNLLLDASGSVKLADFGLAREVAGESDLTATAAVLGTPGFMSPEQLRNREPGPASDLYSLGATLYLLLTGRKPFDVGTLVDAVHHLTKPAPDPRSLRPDCPPWLARFVRRLLEKAPDDRFADAGAAREALARRAITALPHRRRLLRQGVIAAAGMVAALAIALSGWSKWAESHRVVRLEKEGRTVRGLSGPGTIVWERQLPSKVAQLFDVDFGGIGKSSTVVVASSETLNPGDTAERSSIWILDRRGEIVSRAFPDDLVGNWPFPFKRRLTARAEAIDLTGDGRPELVVRCNQNGFYPSALVVYWPEADSWESILVHSGWVMQVSPVEGMPGRLRFIGVNNPLGMQIVAGELEVPRAARTGWHAKREVGVLPLLTWPEAPGSVSLRWYSLLGETGREGPPVVVPGPGPFRFRFGGREHALDEWGNPEPGPNAGRDLAGVRRLFLSRLELLLPSLKVPTPDDIRRFAADLRRDTAPLQSEGPYRIALDLLEARALSRAGDPRAAARLLERTEKDVASEDVTFRLAHLQAVAGDLSGGRERLHRIVGGEGYRSVFDSTLFLLRIFIEERSREAYRRGVAQMIAPDGHTGDEAKLATFVARSRLWWDELEPADLGSRSWLLAPDGDAIGGLARWRAGQTAPEDPERMKSALERYPDAAFEGRLALGAALLGVGRAGEASTELDSLVDHLEPLSRDDFQNHQLLQLVRAVRLKAMLAAGDRERVRQEAIRVRSALRPGLLPRILVDEVIAVTALGR